MENYLYSPSNLYSQIYVCMCVVCVPTHFGICMYLNDPSECILYKHIVAISMCAAYRIHLCKKKKEKMQTATILFYFTFKLNERRRRRGKNISYS